jgi:anti-sigma B factor antagonist
VEDPHERSEAPAADERGIRPATAYAIESGPSSGGVDVLVLRGELDMAAAPELRARLEGAAGALVVDMSAATFIDSAVLKELLRARAELGDRGARLVLAGVSGLVRRLLDLTRTSELFEDAPDAEAAVRRLRA